MYSKFVSEITLYDELQPDTLCDISLHNTYLWNDSLKVSQTQTPDTMSLNCDVISKKEDEKESRNSKASTPDTVSILESPNSETLEDDAGQKHGMRKLCLGGKSEDSIQYGPKEAKISSEASTTLTETSDPSMSLYSKEHENSVHTSSASSGYVMSTGQELYNMTYRDSEYNSSSSLSHLHCSTDGAEPVVPLPDTDDGIASDLGDPTSVEGPFNMSLMTMNFPTSVESQCVSTTSKPQFFDQPSDAVELGNEISRTQQSQMTLMPDDPSLSRSSSKSRSPSISETQEEVISSILGLAPGIGRPPQANFSTWSGKSSRISTASSDTCSDGYYRIGLHSEH